MPRRLLFSSQGCANNKRGCSDEYEVARKRRPVSSSPLHSLPRLIAVRLPSFLPLFFCFLFSLARWFRIRIRTTVQGSSGQVSRPAHAQ